MLCPRKAVWAVVLLSPHWYISHYFSCRESNCSRDISFLEWKGQNILTANSSTNKTEKYNEVLVYLHMEQIHFVLKDPLSVTVLTRIPLQLTSACIPTNTFIKPPGHPACHTKPCVWEEPNMRLYPHLDIVLDLRGGILNCSSSVQITPWIDKPWHFLCVQSRWKWIRYILSEQR